MTGPEPCNLEYDFIGQPIENLKGSVRAAILRSSLRDLMVSVALLYLRHQLARRLLPLRQWFGRHAPLSSASCCRGKCGYSDIVDCSDSCCHPVGHGYP